MEGIQDAVAERGMENGQWMAGKYFVQDYCIFLIYFFGNIFS
jgi:hypothetical protein